MRDPERLARVREVVVAAAGSTVFPGLVRLVGKVAGSDCAQLSLLAGEQVATAVRCAGAGYSELASALEESLCTITVLSGDVLVAADTAAAGRTGQHCPGRAGGQVTGRSCSPPPAARAYCGRSAIQTATAGVCPGLRQECGCTVRKCSASYAPSRNGLPPTTNSSSPSST